MVLTSAQLWFFIALAALVIWFRMRKKPLPPPVSRGKQIALKGEKIQAWLTPTMPLACLLEDGKSFGPAFQNKEPPRLPHGPGCQCKLLPDYRRADEVFLLKEKQLPSQECDLGLLSHHELRYYRYCLIAAHAEASEELQQEYRELALGVDVAETFAQRVQAHIQQ